MRSYIEIKPVKTVADHAAAPQEMDGLMPAELGTPEEDRLDILVTRVEAYEPRHFLMALPDPIDATKFRMEQKCLTPKDLQPMNGRSNRVYEMLRGTRPLTLAMISRLHEGLGIPAECLIKRPAPVATQAAEKNRGQYSGPYERSDAGKQPVKILPFQHQPLEAVPLRHLHACPGPA